MQFKEITYEMGPGWVDETPCDRYVVLRLQPNTDYVLYHDVLERAGYPLNGEFCGPNIKCERCEALGHPESACPTTPLDVLRLANEELLATLQPPTFSLYERVTSYFKPASA